jgi:hypothetical protein
VIRQMHPRQKVFFIALLLLCFGVLAGAAQRVCAQGEVQRRIVALAATSSGSGVIAAVNDDDTYAAPHVFMVSPSTGHVMWQLGKLPRIASVAVAPDEGTVAIGFVGVPDGAPGVVLLETQTGKQVSSLGFDEKLIFAPGVTYPRFGVGVSQLAYSPDTALLYGLSNDTLFAWDLAAKHYLWIRDVPALIKAPPDLPDPLPYGHATTFALSPDGRQLAAARDVLRVATAGHTRPMHFIRRDGSPSMDIATPTFSSDSRILAAGEIGSSGGGRTATYATDLWISGSTRSVRIADCGGGIAWTEKPDVFACQNNTGAHLRNIHDPQKDIGVAGPPSDLPILKVGPSLWVAAYRSTDWKEPGKPLPLTLVELGTGKRVTVTLPGRTQSPAVAR